MFWVILNLYGKTNLTYIIMKNITKYFWWIKKLHLTALLSLKLPRIWQAEVPLPEAGKFLLSLIKTEEEYSLKLQARMSEKDSL